VPAVAESYDIQGRTVALPVEVRRARQWMAAFVVPAERARAIVAPTGLEVAEPRAGRALLALAVVRYEDGDLDSYDELAVSFLVRRHDAAPDASARERAREVRRNRAAVYIHHLPVNQGFTLEAGRTIWGYPKFLAEFASRSEGGRTAWTLRHQGAEVLSLTFKDGGLAWPRQRPLPTYTFLDGTLRMTPWECRLTRVRGRLGGATITLGEHPIADELRSLGLPKRPLMSTGAANLWARFGRAEVVRGPAAPSSVSSEKESAPTTKNV
jgi:hypothetical protein